MTGAWCRATPTVDFDDGRLPMHRRGLARWFGNPGVPASAVNICVGVSLMTLASWFVHHGAEESSDAPILSTLLAPGWAPVWTLVYYVGFVAAALVALSRRTSPLPGFLALYGGVLCHAGAIALGRPGNHFDPRLSEGLGLALTFGRASLTGGVVYLAGSRWFTRNSSG